VIEGLLSLGDVVQATGARVHPALVAETLAARRVRGVSMDTRTTRPGDLFVALAGPHTDGHRFIPAAAAAGAIGALASRLPADPPPSLPILLVPDTLRALGAVGARYRQALSANVVGITGSVGKTTVAALAAAVLARRFRVVRSEESWNAEIGVPLTLLRATADTEVIVAEMAMRGPGQIRELVEIARPQIGVVTNVAESHLGLLGSLEQIAQAKGELIAGLPGDGVAILNADDPWSGQLAALARSRIVRFGFTPIADVRAEEVALAGATAAFRLVGPSGAIAVRLPLAGRHNVANALAAAAVGMVLQVPPPEIAAALAEAAPPRGRLEVAEAGNLIILNDTYNASPTSVRAALEVLEALSAERRRIVVLGDMKELGAFSADLHRAIGREVAQRGVAALIAVGPEAQALAAGAREIMDAGQVRHVPDAAAAVAALRQAVRPGDLVLVKGSRAMGLEVVVDALRTELIPGGGAKRDGRG
jgi:UDP-N-acetylmuramoyl-tripeptide--D-alanyl-D-alanine ligase